MTTSWVMELDTELPMHDLINAFSKAHRNLTFSNAVTHPKLAWYQVNSEGRYIPYDPVTGQFDPDAAQAPLDLTPKGLAEKYLIDVADIPGHPPVYLPGAEIPLPQHVMHDIRECLWCMEHPVMKAKTAR